MAKKKSLKVAVVNVDKMQPSIAEKVVKGSNLRTALFVILGMVITLSSSTLLETKMNQKTKSSVGAFYNSESGVEWALNQIATKSGTAQISTIGACPFTGCSVLFLGADGKVLASSATIDQVKAVRSVGTQGGDTQRAIEAAVAGTGGGCFTYYCNYRDTVSPDVISNSYRNQDALTTGTNFCTNNGGTRGYCPSGFQQKYQMGSYGSCSVGQSYAWTYPVGGACHPGEAAFPVGEGFVCCQN